MDILICRTTQHKKWHWILFNDKHNITFAPVRWKIYRYVRVKTCTISNLLTILGHCTVKPQSSNREIRMTIDEWVVYRTFYSGSCFTGERREPGSMRTFFKKYHALLCIEDSNRFYHNKLSFSNKKKQIDISKKKLFYENTKSFHIMCFRL